MHYQWELIILINFNYLTDILRSPYSLDRHTNEPYLVDISLQHQSQLHKYTHGLSDCNHTYTFDE